MSRVPNQFHYIWYSDDVFEMKYLQYFSIVSLIVNSNTPTINLFTNKGFKGRLWDKVKDYVNVYFIDRPDISVFDGDSRTKNIAHSDIMRNYIIHKYGGIYIDFDVIWMKPVDSLLNELDELADDKPIYAIGQQGKNGCEGLNMGVILGEAGNLFFPQYIDSYKMYDKYVKDPGSHIQYYSIGIPKSIVEGSKAGIVLPHNYFHWPLYHVTKNWFLGGEVHPELQNGPKFNQYGGGYWSNEPLDTTSYAHHCFWIDYRLNDGDIRINAFDQNRVQSDLEKGRKKAQAGQYDHILNMTVREFIETVDSPFTTICKPLLKFSEL